MALGGTMQKDMVIGNESGFVEERRGSNVEAVGALAIKFTGFRMGISSKAEQVLANYRSTEIETSGVGSSRIIRPMAALDLGGMVVGAEYELSTNEKTGVGENEYVREEYSRVKTAMIFKNKYVEVGGVYSPKTRVEYTIENAAEDVDAIVGTTGASLLPEEYLYHARVAVDSRISFGVSGKYVKASHANDGVDYEQNDYREFSGHISGNILSKFKMSGLLHHKQKSYKEATLAGPETIERNTYGVTVDNSINSSYKIGAKTWVESAQKPQVDRNEKNVGYENINFAITTQVKI